MALASIRPFLVCRIERENSSAASAYATTSRPVLPILCRVSDNARKKVIFHNPNDTAKIAVCPIGPSRAVGSSQSLIVAVINGTGCITLLPYQSQEISGSTASGPQQAMGISVGRHRQRRRLQYHHLGI